MSQSICIPLTQGKCVLIDAEDVDRVSPLRWCALRRTVNGRTTWYAVRHAPGENNKLIYLHRFILNAPMGVYVDHRDGDGLNCQRSNIRLATPSQNSCNTPKRFGKHRYKGIRSKGGSAGFYAKVWVKGECFSSGPYLTEEEAAIAYDELALLHHGEFASLNFPNQGGK